jgi:predicted nucleic acid-binding protein
LALPLVGRLLLDTNVFIDYLRDGAHERWVFGHVGATVRFLSSVVLAELRLGADTLPRRRIVDRLRNAFPPERHLAPTPASFDKAGTIFRGLFTPGNEPKDRLGAWNDILIALTARQIGAAVITQNARDFERMGEFLPGLVVLDPNTYLVD